MALFVFHAILLIIGTYKLNNANKAPLHPHANRDIIIIQRNQNACYALILYLIATYVHLLISVASVLW